LGGVVDNDRGRIIQHEVNQMLPGVKEQILSQGLKEFSQTSEEKVRSLLDIEDEELLHWDRVSRRMFVPFHDDGIISQFAGTRL